MYTYIYMYSNCDTNVYMRYLVFDKPERKPTSDNIIFRKSDDQMFWG